MSEATTLQKIHVHRLDGCRPTPLAHYLKALGVLRLVALQADPDVRGWWAEDVFHLATKLSKDDLEIFFESNYRPTPMMAPWLPRSGFSNSSSHSKTRQFLDEIMECDDQRFDDFRNWYTLIKELATVQGANLDSPDELRNHKFITSARSLASLPIQSWIDSCVVSDSETISYPAIFGSGGNEGSGSYLANFYVAICALLVRKMTNFDACLHGQTTLSGELTKFLNAANFNSGHFTESMGDDAGTFILAMEGILTLKASLSRKLSGNLGSNVSGTGASMAAPFSVGNSTIGYASCSDEDSFTLRQGTKTPGRGEQWFPLWTRPSTIREVLETFRLARCILSKSRVERSKDFLRSVSRSGTNAGISSFSRFGYFQRNGGNHMAIPLGIYKVRQQENQHLLDAVSPWIDQLRRIANGKNAPISLKRVYRSCEDALLLCTQRANAKAFLSLLMAMADAEDQYLKCPKYAADANARPIPKLDKEWLELIWNDSHFKNDHEVRLAFALAAQVGNLGSNTTPKDNDSVFIRDYWLPLERNQRSFLKGERGLASGPDQCAFGLPLEKALHKLFQRRLHEADSGKGKTNASLQLLRNYLGARLDDINAFIDGRVNDARILSVARALMAIDFRPVQGDKVFELAAAEDAGSRTVEDAVRDRKFDQSPLGGMAAYGVIRLAFGGGTKLDGSFWVPDAGSIHVRNDSIIYNRLIAGDLQGAIERAIRRAFISGLRPRIQVAVGSPEFARRIGAAICFGVSDATMTRIALGLTSSMIPISDEFESDFVAEK